MPYALCAPVFVREDNGRLAPATVLSPSMGLVDVPALGRFYDVRTPYRSQVVHERRLAPARPQPQSRGDGGIEATSKDGPA
jgi:hypothetical protein